MKITEVIDITKSCGELTVTINGLQYGRSQFTNDEYDSLLSLYDSCRLSKTDREVKLQNYIDSGFLPKGIFGGSSEENNATEEVVVELTDEQKLERGLGNLINFFSEFEFEPNFRFVNTLSIKLQKSNKCAIDYIKDYFSLIDNPYVNEIGAKVRCVEFKNILNDLKILAPTKTVNNRFKVYYGSAGTGKTTLAQSETDNRCVVCNASMLPSDLMENFVFVDGNPTFEKSSLWNCMEKGLPIVLDEINLLPFDSLRFLQGILDGKTEFDYKGKKVTIADGFQIIGTMNLTIGGMVYGLPEPLVDRSADMKQFKLEASQLMGAIV